MPSMPPPTYLEGHVSVEAALRGRSRPIHRVLVAAEGVRAERAAARILRLAAERDISVERPRRAAIDTLAAGASHGGVLAEVGERLSCELEELAAAPSPFVVMLDGVEDPYNFGAALRSLYAAGTTGLVVRSRNWLSASAIVARASAGASELLPVAVIDDVVAAAETLRLSGLRVVCAAQAPDALPIGQVDLRQPLFLLIGGERRGVMRSLMAEADLLVRIPYARRDASSLGTAAAAAVIGFEVRRQRAQD
jgi:23S rRNA (guanosine2251-2'-O)-methyltransferase